MVESHANCAMLKKAYSLAFLFPDMQTTNQDETLLKGLGIAFCYFLQERMLHSDVYTSLVQLQMCLCQISIWIKVCFCYVAGGISQQ